MRSIKVKFLSFLDISIFEAANEETCYIIWDSQSKKRPSYIGSGNALSRIAKHAKDGYALPIDGYIAICDSKKDAEIVEAALIDMFDPLHNQRSGNFSKVTETLFAENKIRILIKGQDPAFHPKNQRKLSKSKQIDFFLDDEGEAKWDSAHWRNRGW